MPPESYIPTSGIRGIVQSCQQKITKNTPHDNDDEKNDWVLTFQSAPKASSAPALGQATVATARGPKSPAPAP